MASEDLKMIRKIRIVCILLAAGVLCPGCGNRAKAVQSDAIKTQVTQNVYVSEEEADEETLYFMEEKDTVETEIESDPDEGDMAEAEEETLKAEEKERPKVKGIFVTGPMAGTSHMENLIELVEDTELNAMVIDVKNDEGRVTYDMQTPMVEELGSGIRYIQDMEALVAKCKEKNIYLIARIVAFKDPFLADMKPEWCIHNADGSVFKDKGGLAWLNPYNKEVWDYLLAIAEEALHMGFDEVQFDYIRFSTDSGMEDVDFGQDGEEKDRQEIIDDFAAYAAEKIHEAGGIVSADVYGMVIDSEVDQRIVGQNYVGLSK